MSSCLARASPTTDTRFLSSASSCVHQRPSPRSTRVFWRSIDSVSRIRPKAGTVRSLMATADSRYGSAFATPSISSKRPALSVVIGSVEVSSTGTCMSHVWTAYEPTVISVMTSPRLSMATTTPTAKATWRIVEMLRPFRRSAFRMPIWKVRGMPRIPIRLLSRKLAPKSAEIPWLSSP